MAIKNHSVSKKISTLKPFNGLPEHQEHSWIPIAQYDSRVQTYTNISLNVESITSYSTTAAFTYSMDNLAYAINYIDTSVAYSTNYAYAYTSDRYYDIIDKLAALSAQAGEQLDAIADLYKLKTEWVNFRNITKGTNYDEVATYINLDPVASTLVGYTFAYTMDALDWQRINGSQPWVTVNSAT